MCRPPCEAIADNESPRNGSSPRGTVGTARSDKHCRQNWSIIFTVGGKVANADKDKLTFDKLRDLKVWV